MKLIRILTVILLTLMLGSCGTGGGKFDTLLPLSLDGELELDGRVYSASVYFDSGERGRVVLDGAEYSLDGEARYLTYGGVTLLLPQGQDCPALEFFAELARLCGSDIASTVSDGQRVTLVCERDGRPLTLTLEGERLLEVTGAGAGANDGSHADIIFRATTEGTT